MSRYVETYAEVKSVHGRSFRERARAIVLDVLSAIGGSKLPETPRVQFLYIHHIFRDEVPALERLLDFLEQNFTIISHSEAVGRLLDDRVDRPYLSISSDDGFKNNLLAGEVFRKRGISACFFINPALVGETDYDAVREHCAEKLHFPPVEFLSWTDVSDLLEMGHEIGSHTMDHMRISEHSREEVRHDLRETYQILKERCGSVQHFAWPYGLFSDFNEAARKEVFDAGFTSCSSAERGAHFGGKKIEGEELCIRRDHIILDWPLAHIAYFLKKAATGQGRDGYS